MIRHGGKLVETANPSKGNDLAMTTACTAAATRIRIALPTATMTKGKAPTAMTTIHLHGEKREAIIAAEISRRTARVKDDVILRCGDPGLPSRIPVMHTIHDPRKTVVNPHNRVGITEYIIHYINKSISLTWPLGRIQMPRRASSLDIAAESKVASVARVVPLPYR
jgi:hypothetical protein